MSRVALGGANQTLKMWPSERLLGHWGVSFKRAVDHSHLFSVPGFLPGYRPKASGPVIYEHEPNKPLCLKSSLKVPDRNMATKQKHGQQTETTCWHIFSMFLKNNFSWFPFCIKVMSTLLHHNIQVETWLKFSVVCLRQHRFYSGFFAKTQALKYLSPSLWEDLCC